MGILLVLAIATTVIGVGLFEYYVEISTTATAEANVFWDGNPSYEIDIDESFSCMVGNNTTYYHNISAVKTTTVKFNITSDEGLTTEIIYEGNPITELILIGGELYDIQTVYTFDEYASAGNYNATIRVEHL